MINNNNNNNNNNIFFNFFDFSLFFFFSTLLVSKCKVCIFPEKIQFFKKSLCISNVYNGITNKQL